MANIKKTARVNIPMCMACALFCLVLISFHLTSGLYARYSDRSNGADTAGVMSFGILTLIETGDFEEDEMLMIIPGVDLTKKAVISFDGSESTSYIFAEIIPSAEWQTADNMEFYITSGSKTLMKWSVKDTWNFLQEKDGAYIYYQELSPNMSLAEDVIADGGNITVSDQINKDEIQDMTDISIKLRAAVIQSNGFEGPTDAWSSLAGGVK